ncbi:hypothetical protein ACWEO2_36145 [Nocardia sp. NPDC004278]
MRGDLTPITSPDQIVTDLKVLIALARRLIDVVWALTRDNRTFAIEAPAPISAAA